MRVIVINNLSSLPMQTAKEFVMHTLKHDGLPDACQDQTISLIHNPGIVDVFVEDDNDVLDDILKLGGYNG